jgi:hypothetical protein
LPDRLAVDTEFGQRSLLYILAQTFENIFISLNRAVGSPLIDKTRFEEGPCARDRLSAFFDSSVQRLPTSVFFPKVLCQPPRFASPHLRPVAELTSDLGRLFDP